jgi:hypothetical protein
MDSFLRTMLTHPRFERYRARIPYTIVAGVVWFALGGIVSVFFALAGHGPGDPNPLVPICCAAGMTGLYLVAAIVGFLSGYRPFIQRWDAMPAGEVRALADRLAAAADLAGWAIAWRGPRGDIVATLGLDPDDRTLVHDANAGPVRLSVFVTERGPQATMRLKIGIRTICLWDSGETARCRELGERLIADASASPLASGQPRG